MKRDDVFGMHEPPPGGLTRLRARLDDEPADPLRWHRAAWVGATLAAIALVWNAPAIAPVELAETPGVVRVGAAQSPRGSVAVPAAAQADLAVLAVAETPEVVFYRVSSTRSEPES